MIKNVGLSRNQPLDGHPEKTLHWPRGSRTIRRADLSLGARMRRHDQLSSSSARPRWATRSRAILTLLVSGLLVAGAAVPAQAASASSAAKAPAPALGCDQMVGQKVSVTGDVARVATATAVAASGATSAYCEVQGTIGAIRFTMRLPIADWNGRYFQTGCGGFCGAVPIASCGQALTRGFAVAAEDTGHTWHRGQRHLGLQQPPRRARLRLPLAAPHGAGRQGADRAVLRAGAELLLLPGLQHRRTRRRSPRRSATRTTSTASSPAPPRSTRTTSPRCPRATWRR